MLGTFLVWETCRQKHNPLLAFLPFRNAGSDFGIVVSFVAEFQLLGSAFLIPFLTLCVLDSSAPWAGLLLFPSGALVGLGLLFANVPIQGRVVAPSKLVPAGVVLFMMAM